MNPRPPRTGGTWWLSPVGILLLMVPFTLALAALNSDGHYRTSWRTAKFLTSPDVALFASGAVLFGLGTVWPLFLAPRRRQSDGWAGSSGERLRKLTAAAELLYWLTVFGYVSLLGIGVVRGFRPSDLVTIITAQDTYDSPLKTIFAPVAGVTTFTQMGIAFVIVGALLLRERWSGKIVRRLVVVVTLGLLRALFLSERLALIELCVPLMVIAFLGVSRTRSRPRYVLAQLAPAIFIPAVVGVFGLFEYFRSWVFYAPLRQQSFVEFMLDRLAGYYATAYNNGAMALEASKGIVRVPYQSVEVLWSAPGASLFDLYGRLSFHELPQSLDVLLAQHANPEFNSPCGLAIPFIDYGLVGGMIFLFLAGSLIGVVFRELRDGTGWATLLYPLLVTGLFELPRYLYWAQGRITPALLGLLLTHVWMSSRRGVVTAPVRRPRPVGVSAS